MCLKYYISDYVIILGILITAFCTDIVGNPMPSPCDGRENITQECLINPSFDTIDSNGVPVGWKFRDPDSSGFSFALDTVTKRDGKGSLKIWVNENGPKDDIFYSQIIPEDIMVRFSEADVYCASAWIKTHEIYPFMKFQVASHQANLLNEPPRYITKSWDRFASSGTGTKDWEHSESTFSIRDGTNHITIRIFLGKDLVPGCTAWVDGIEIFADIPEDTTPLFNTNSPLLSKSRTISFNGSQVTFSRPTDFNLHIFSTDGKMVLQRSNYGKKINLFNYSLPPGCYIVNIQSKSNKLINTRFIVPPK